jgi:hypothetical protein
MNDRDKKEIAEQMQNLKKENNPSKRKQLVKEQRQKVLNKFIQNR